MPKYKGLFKAKKGSIGDVTFAKTIDGYQMREKNEISAEAIATSPSFQRTRENMAEFSRAGKAGKVLRHALRHLLQNAKDRRVTSRLVKAMRAVIATDTTNARGERTVTDGDVELLKGFDFNGNADLVSTLYARYTATIDRPTGVLTVSIPAMIPTSEIAAPLGTTHYRLVCGGVAADFDGEDFTAAFDESGYLPWARVTAPVLNLTVTLPAASPHPLFLAAGVLFYQEVNGMYYELKSGVHNALSLVEVEG